MIIGFVGLSHLGIVTSFAAASKGCEVIGHDPDLVLCRRLQAGDLPVFEPGLPELRQAHRTRIRFTHEAAALSRCELVVFAPDIPTDVGNRSDVSVLERLLEHTVGHVPAEATLVILSQVPPGFTRTLAQRRGASRVYYQVETLVFGSAVERACHPERFIVGCWDPQAPLPPAYHEWLKAFDCPVFPMRYESAELAKIAVNMFLASSVSTANTLAELCEVLGADWDEIIPALQADRRIGPQAYLRPGLGLAGGNLERDLETVRELASQHGTEAGIVDAWLVNSAHRREWVLKALREAVGPADHDPAIGVWGLAYKPHTHSTKNSPALNLLEALRPCTVTAYDPQAVLPESGFSHVSMAASALDACASVDALAILTAWPEFASIDPGAIRARMRGRLVVDPFGVLDGRRCAEAGLRHRRLGLPAADEVSDERVLHV